VYVNVCYKRVLIWMGGGGSVCYCVSQKSTHLDVWGCEYVFVTKWYSLRSDTQRTTCGRRVLQCCLGEGGGGGGDGGVS